MATKTITITEDAYDFLSAKKEDYESFSDVIKRLSGESDLLELAGLLTKEEADLVEKRIKESRKESNKRMERIRKSLQ
ncbi:antitoxin VapB family protein [Candidatus Woesearchaeota archaeon]|nr:antitoxin VapB family protein [Candidatus Woesearchaeota archaeon]